MATSLDPARLIEVRAGMESAGAKVRHAAKHLSSLNYQAHKWVNAYEHESTTEFDSEEGWLIERVGPIKEPPEILGLLAGDLVNDLRGALDHTVYQLARLTVDDPDGTQFPIFTDPDAYRRPRKGRPSFRETYLTGVPDEYRTFIDDCQPFEAPDPAHDRLKVLNDFSNIDKHRLIHATYFLPPTDMKFEPLNFTTPSYEVRFPAPAPLKEGAELFRVRLSMDTKYDVGVENLMAETDYSFDVAFGPNLVPLNELTDVMIYVMRIVGTIGIWLDSPAGLPFPGDPQRTSPLREDDPKIAAIKRRRDAKKVRLAK